VFVSGTSWTQSYRDTLAAKGLGDATYGFAVDPAAPLDELPWTNLNRFSVRFSEDVNVSVASLTLRTTVSNNRGVLGNFTYDAATRTASWTMMGATGLPAPGLANEKLALDLTGVTGGLSGLTLTGGTVSSSGATVRTRLDILPGDVNRSGGAVLGSDVTLTRNAQNLAPDHPNYRVFYDVNGSGGILGSDVTLVRNAQGRSLPPGEPLPMPGDSLVATTTAGKTSTATTTTPVPAFVRDHEEENAAKRDKAVVLRIA
jgi:hypothetical protein